VSVANPTPLFSLVRADSLRLSESAYLTAETSPVVPSIDNARDEILLVDPLGEPCAIPQMSPSLEDYEHNMSDGSILVNKRAMPVEINLALDYIGNNTHARLLRWMADRASVYFTPGFGVKTELALRPMSSSVAAITDLTGRWPVTIVCDRATSYTFDNYNSPQGVMRLYSSEYMRLVKTPFGAGAIMESGHSNLFYTGSPPGSYPVGTSNADSGWETWGSWAADVSREFITHGFGMPAAPGALRVYSATRRTGDGTNGRVLARGLPAAVTGACSVCVGVMLKGRGGSGLKLQLVNTNGLLTSRSLASVDLSEWTMCWINAYHANWPAVSANQNIKIDLAPATGSTDDFDLMVGPSVCVIQADSSQQAPAFPQWRLNTRASGDFFRATSFVFPRSGTAMFSMYIPSGWYYETTSPWCAKLISPASGYAFHCDVRGGSGSYPNAAFVMYWGSGGSDVISASVGASVLTPGRVVTFGITWNNERLVVYCNGVAIATRTGSIQPPTSETTFSFFGDGSYGSAGFVPLAIRVDNEVFSASRMADLHATAADNLASGMIVAARGRKFQIVEIPGSHRSSRDGTHWLGTLKLRQVDYVPALADICTKE
jgi:hypothetical protein